MWHTPNGDRTLTGAEAVLLRNAVAYLRDTFAEEADPLADPWIWRVPVFDQLIHAQKVALLTVVAQALLCRDVPCPPLTAVNEATIGVLFKAIEQCIAMEVDAQRSGFGKEFDVTAWRRMLLAAAMVENHDGNPVSDGYIFPLPDCTDAAEWDVLLEVLESTILWDDDWQMDDLFMDVEPRVSRARKRHLGIERDYFTALAPDPTPPELVALDQKLKDLCHQPDN